MKTLFGIILVALSLAAGARRDPVPVPPSAQPAIRFSYVDIFVDSRQQPLAAYEFELKATSGDVKFVGVAAGDDRGFQDPPYYDQARMQYQNPARIVIGAWSLADKLPTGKTRVARVSVATEGNEEPTFAVRMIVAGTKGGAEIPADVTIAEGAAQ